MNSDDFEKTEESIFDLLSRIQARPAVFLDGDPSLKRLRSFLVGYECGLGSLRFTPRDRELFHAFHDWIASQLGFAESTSGWCNMILEKTENDKDAYYRFFQLLEQFRREKGIAN
jgi:hypothetical protein